MDNVLVFKFTLNDRDFEVKVQEAQKQIKKIGEAVKKSAKDTSPVDSLIKKYATWGVVLGAAKKALDIVLSGMRATGSGADKLAILTEQASSVFATFSKQIANIGLSDFNLSIADAIKYAGEFQKKMNSFTLLKFSDEMKSARLEMELTRLESQKSLPNADAGLIDNQIKGLREQQIAYHEKAGQEAALTFISKFREVTQAKGTLMFGDVAKIFDSKSDVYIGKLKEAYEKIEAYGSRNNKSPKLGATKAQKDVFWDACLY
jgi:hypothetical protein